MKKYDIIFRTYYLLKANGDNFSSAFYQEAFLTIFVILKL